MEKGKSLRESEGTGGGDPACRQAGEAIFQHGAVSQGGRLLQSFLLRNDPSPSFPFFQTNLSVILNVSHTFSFECPKISCN